MNDLRLLRALIAVAPLLAGSAFAAAPVYDPLVLSDSGVIETLDATVHDKSRAREIPLRIYLPKERVSAPVVLFSHGLGGSCQGSVFLGKHWAARGYVAVFLQHSGSDTSVWKDAPSGERMTAMKQASSPQNFLLRVKDVPATLDQLERWNGTDGHALRKRLDFKRIGMSGHSFGAMTTQAVSGQTFLLAEGFTDPRIKAAIVFSPSSPLHGDTKRAFGNVQMPWLLMTGTKDLSVIGGADLESRLGVFPALPPGGKYELVLHGAEHSAFTDRALPGDTEERNPNHHRVILALSAAFWDAYLRGDTAARAWLDGEGPRSVLEQKDRWQTK